ncbi:hypothetical protein AAF712_016816, partial [Marasmius tenuissimus]
NLENRSPHPLWWEKTTATRDKTPSMVMSSSRLHFAPPGESYASENRLNPDSGPSKIPRLTSNKTIRRTYNDPQTPQKRKLQRQPDNNHDSSSPSPAQPSESSTDAV